MSRYELVARAGMSEELDDDSISYDAVKDRLKRKKFKRTMMAITCVTVLFFIAAGVAIGVVMGITKSKHSDVNTSPPSASKSFRATAVVNSYSTVSLSHHDKATSTTTRDTSKTSSTMSIHEASSYNTRSYTSVVSPTTVASPAHHVTDTRKTTSVSNHIQQATSTTTATTTSTAINIITTKPTVDIIASSGTTTTTVMPVHVVTTVTSHDHGSERTTDYYPTTTTTTDHYPTTTSSTKWIRASSQHASVTTQVTTSPSPTVVLPIDTGNSQIFDYIDAFHNPCDNFYEYSCGLWHNSHPLASEWGTSQDLALDNYNSIARYLSQYASYHDPTAIRKAKYMYSSCIDSDYISSNFVSRLKSFMVNAGGWENGYFYPHQSWSINSSLYKDHYLGSSAFFSFGISPDDLNSSRSVIRIYQAGLTYGSPEKYLGEDFSKLTTTIQNILEALHPLGEYYSTAYDIAHFERLLAFHWLTNTELRNVSALYNPMTLDELSEIFSMDWINYFNNYFKKAGHSWHFSGNTVVIVETPSYFRAVNRYLTRSVVEDYAKWQLLVNELSLYTASLPQDSWRILQDIKFPKTSKLSLDTKLNCVELVENAMPMAVARPFVEEFITNSTVVKVAEVASQIKKAFIQRIAEKEWLDEITKNRTIEKVHAITEQIAYPDFIKIDRELDSVYADLDISYDVTYFDALSAIREFAVRKMISRYFHPTRKTEWLDLPTEVNAYYSPQFNQFVVLAGILRPPFYASNWSPFLAYGALGTVIGHELSHAFDDQGQQYNKDGNRVQWWTDRSIRKFKKRTQCFVDQYDRYTLQGYSIDGQLTLGENIADNGGVHTAFRAYKDVMNGIAEQHIGGYSGDQLFFVAYAQLWCSKFTSKALESSTKSDPHSPGPIRVLGSLVNSEEFAATFQCSLGSRMYPSNERCELW